MILNAAYRLRATHEDNATPENVDDAFNFSGIAYDNRKGAGNTPLGANVAYLGCTTFIKPSVFRKLAAPADRTEDTAKLKKLMEDGRPIAVPFLEIAVDEKGMAKIKTHEGRARADAIRELTNDAYMPVQMFFRGEFDRARYITDDLLKSIAEKGIVPEKSTTPINCGIKQFFLMGRVVTFK